MNSELGAGFLAGRRPLANLTASAALRGGWEEEYAYTLGLQAYVYGFPWMYLAQLRWLWTTEAGKKLAEKEGLHIPWAPINTFFHSPNLATPETATGGSPNHDTLYSVAWLDVGDEPIVITVPEVTDRFYCFQMACIDSDNFAYVGTKQTGTAAANYLIGGPGWAGDVPDDVADVIPRSRTPAVLIFGRTGVNDDSQEELDKAHAVQAGYALTPLSKWPGGGHRPVRPPRAEIPFEFNPANPHGDWHTMNRSMTENPPGVPPGIDQTELLKLFATIGIGPDQSLDAQSLATRRGLQRAARDGYPMLHDMAAGRGIELNNWNYPPRCVGRAGQASDFITRAAVQALAGIADHDPDQAVYVNTTLDATGAKLQASGKYSITFPAGGFPPFDPTYHGFWSLTMYQSSDFNLVQGSDNYFVNSYYPQFQARATDGSMTVLIQRDVPDELGAGVYYLQTPDPTDQTNFYLILRVYVPGPEVGYTQTWAPPPVVPHS